MTSAVDWAFKRQFYIYLVLVTRFEPRVFGSLPRRAGRSTNPATPRIMVMIVKDSNHPVNAAMGSICPKIYSLASAWPDSVAPNQLIKGTIIAVL